VAVVVAEFECRRPDHETLDPLDEAPPIRAAPKLAVGNYPKARRFLQRNHVADAAIQYLCKIFPVDAFRLVILVRLPQFGWPQQAADVVGTEWRSAIGAREHRYPPGRNDSIDL